MQRFRLVFVSLGFAAVIQAGTLTLTTAGISDGFTLTTFATVDPGGIANMGPYGVAVTGGHVLVNNYINNTLYVFNDADGQTTSSAIATINPSNSYSIGFASTGGVAYGGVDNTGPVFVQFNSNGTVNHILTGVTQTPYFGMAGNPVNGHIIATTGQGQIIDINPAGNGGTGSAAVIASPFSASSSIPYDGVTVSPDGSTAYVEENSHIIGYNLTTYAQVYDSGALSGGPDGIGVISSNNALNGMLIVNFNGATLVGSVALLNPSTNTLTTIASGGTRGDYVSPDPSNGTVFLDYSDLIYRLGCGSGCSIASPSAPTAPTSTPVPSTLSLAISGLAISGLIFGWRKLAFGSTRRVS